MCILVGTMMYATTRLKDCLAGEKLHTPPTSPAVPVYYGLVSK